MDTFRSIILLLLVGLLPQLVVPAAEAAQPANNNGDPRGGVQVYHSQENNPRAVVKEGLFVGIGAQRVAILEGRKSKKKSYRLDEAYRVIYNGQEVDWQAFSFKQIPPHSIVKLVMIDGLIVEIILVEVSS